MFLVGILWLDAITLDPKINISILHIHIYIRSTGLYLSTLLRFCNPHCDCIHNAEQSTHSDPIGFMKCTPIAHSLERQFYWLFWKYLRREVCIFIVQLTHKALNANRWLQRKREREKEELTDNDDWKCFSVTRIWAAASLQSMLK